MCLGSEHQIGSKLIIIPIIIRLLCIAVTEATGPLCNFRRHGDSPPPTIE